MIFRIGIRKTEQEIRQEADEEKARQQASPDNIDLIVDSEQEAHTPGR